jgi:hypothetical protein
MKHPLLISKNNQIDEAKSRLSHCTDANGLTRLYRDFTVRLKSVFEWRRLIGRLRRDNLATPYFFKERAWRLTSIFILIF